MYTTVYKRSVTSDMGSEMPYCSQYTLWMAVERPCFYTYEFANANVTIKAERQGQYSEYIYIC